jgi:hypothetical protein
MAPTLRSAAHLRILFAMTLGIALFMSRTPAYADNIYTFNLIPADGQVSGPPGSTVGWGYSITNESTTEWLVFVSLNSDPFQYGTPNSLFDFPVLAPLTNVTEPFDPQLGIGLFEFTWDTTAPLGFVNSGIFTVSAQWWTGNPLNGGQFIEDAPDGLAAYSASVVGSTPEPSSLLLLLSGTGALAGLRKLSKQWTQAGQIIAEDWRKEKRS